MPFCWKKYVPVHGENPPCCSLMSGWNGFTSPRAGSFLSHSCVCKCFRWRDSNKMQPGAFRGKEMSCHHPCVLCMKWDTWTDLCPHWGDVTIQPVLPWGINFYVFFVLEYTESEITEDFFSYPQPLILCYLLINLLFSWSRITLWRKIQEFPAASICSSKLPHPLHMANLSSWQHHPLNLR